MRYRPLRALAAVAALWLTAAADPPRSPAELYGPLFEAVQRERVFDDGKTCVDATARATPPAILDAYAREKPTTREQLKAFVERHFILPDAAADGRADNLVAHIKGLWPQLTRPPLDPPAGSSALALPATYLVPGGRLREI